MDSDGFGSFVGYAVTGIGNDLNIYKLRYVLEGRTTQVTDHSAGERLYKSVSLAVFVR